MDAKREILRHALAALAYRTQKALRDAPSEFGDFEAGAGVRTPSAIVRHMTAVLAHARLRFVGGTYEPPMPVSSLAEETSRLHGAIADLARHIESGTPMRGTSPERLLQGPLADAMTHAGQIAILRRLAGVPVPPENFMAANVDPENLGPDQPDPVSPHESWPDAPPGWTPGE